MIQINELIDQSLGKLIALTIEEFNSYKPETVAEQLAKTLVQEAMGEGGIKAIQMIADRSGGRAAAKKADHKKTEIAEKLEAWMGVKDGK